MFSLIATENNFTMTSYDFLNEIINPARKSAGENPIRNNDFLRKVQDEIEDLGRYEFFVTSNNRIKCYTLNIEQMTLIGMRESKAVRRRVLDTLKKLSLRNEPKIPQTYSEALQLAADQAKQLEEQAPKVEYYNTVAKNETHLNATQVGQKIGLSGIALNKLLDQIGVYNRAVKRGRVFLQWFIDEGYGAIKQTPLGYSQAVFTVKGEQYIIEKLTQEGLI